MDNPGGRGRQAAEPPRHDLESKSASVSIGAAMVILGSILVGVATLLPWATESIGAVSISHNAFELGNHRSVTYVGPVVVVLAVIGVLIAVARLTGGSVPRRVQTSAVVLGVAMVLVIALSYPARPSGLSSSLAGVLVSFAVGFGFWLCLVGALVVFFGGLVMLSRPRVQRPPSTTG